MAWLDIIFIVLFIIGAVKGYSKGLVMEIFSFLAFFAGLFLAIELTIPLASTYFDGSGYFQFVTIGVFIGVFVLVIIGINFVGKIIKKALDLTFLGIFDSILGVFASLFKWAFIISVFFWIMDSVGFRLSDQTAGDSLIFPWIQNIGPAVFNLVASLVPMIRDMMDSIDDISKKHREVYAFVGSFKYV